MLRALLVSSSILAAPAALAEDDPCATVGPEAGLPALATALEAYAQLDPELFASSLAQAELGLECLDPTLTPEWEAQLWLARGLDGWLRRDKPALVEAFDQLVLVGPDIEPGPSLVPAGSALDKALIAAKAKRAAAAATPPGGGGGGGGGGAGPAGPGGGPPGGRCESSNREMGVCGAMAMRAAAAWTTSSSSSEAAGAGAVLPVQVGEPESGPTAEPVLATAAAPTQRRSSWALLGTGLAAGALAGGAALVSQRSEDPFWAADLRYDAQLAYAVNRATGFTAYGAAGLSAGLVLGAVVVGRW